MDKKTRILAIATAVGDSILIISSPSGSIVIPKPNTSSTCKVGKGFPDKNDDKLLRIVK